MKKFGAILAAAALFAAACNGNGEGGTQSDAIELGARETFAVSAVEAVEMDGYKVESAVCEVVAPQSYRPNDNIFGGRLVFHAFRVSVPGVGGEAVVLFASNHVAADGAGLTIPVNDAAVDLDQGFTPGSQLTDPVTENMAGASEAIECARNAGGPPAVEGDDDFDVEGWRSEAVARFGPEETFADGSKRDYVELAFAICDQRQSEREQMRQNLGADYEGSLQRFIIEEFCPNV